MEDNKRTTSLAFGFGGMLLSVVSLAVYWIMSALFAVSVGTNLSAGMSITTSLIAILLCAALSIKLLGNCIECLFKSFCISLHILN